MLSRLKSNAFQVNWYYILPIILMMILIYGFINFSLSKRIEGLQTELQESTVQAISLHEKLGYGGLIHNFKNYVLRGDETYLQDAKIDAAQALAELELLEEGARDQGVELRLSQTRLMIQAYSSRLENIQALLKDGASVEDIDIAVKYDDSDALLEINQVLEAIRDDIETQLSSLQRISLIQTTATAVVSVFIIFFSLLLSRISRHRAELQSANEDLSDTLEKTEKANDALSQFAGVASHDLRTPIRHIKLFADMISEDAEDPREVRAHADNIRGSADRMNNLVQSLLAFAKTSNTEPRLSEVEMNDLAASVLKDIAPRLKETQAVISVGDLPKLRADGDLLRQVFINLIDNAIKYVPEGRAPEIDITARPYEGKWQFSFTDNGIGIEPQYTDKIFLPLQRLHSHNSEYQGVGIGLALVKNVIESHNGRVWLDPDYKTGARFLFTL